jgi:hypothetical protein
MKRNGHPNIQCVRSLVNMDIAGNDRVKFAHENPGATCRRLRVGEPPTKWDGLEYGFSPGEFRVASTTLPAIGTGSVSGVARAPFLRSASPVHHPRHADALSHLVNPPAGGEIEDAAIIHELHGHPMAFAVWQVFRLVSFWIGESPQGRQCFNRAGPVRALLADISHDEQFTEDDPRAALVLVLIELVSAKQDRVAMARACFVVGDWALGRGAMMTGLLYMRAGAGVQPDARSALITGRLHRDNSRIIEAEPWFEASYRLAVRGKDWEACVLALMAKGHSRLLVGRYVEARRLFTRASRLAALHRLDELRWRATHNLLAEAAGSHDYRRAATFAATLSNVYTPAHPRYAYLVHDRAVLQMDRGEFDAVADTLQPLVAEGHFENDPSGCLIATGSALRAAGVAGRHRDFDRLLSGLNDLRNVCRLSPHVPSALIAAARGAISLRRWRDAENLLVPALASAGASGQEDSLDEVERLLIALP